MIEGNIRESTASIMNKIPMISAKKVSKSRISPQKIMTVPEFSLQLEKCPSGSSNEKCSIRKSYQSGKSDEGMQDLYKINSEF